MAHKEIRNLKDLVNCDNCVIVKKEKCEINQIIENKLNPLVPWVQTIEIHKLALTDLYWIIICKGNSRL